MKGLIIFYINFQDKIENFDVRVDAIRTYNKELFSTLEGDGYKIGFVPTINESCRVERVEFETTTFVPRKVQS